MATGDELLPTRQSLLSRLKDWNDQESWRVFFETYWKLIYQSAIKAGLSEAEAQDVVQETVLAVSKSMKTFEYKAQNGSFKSWLLNLTRWRIMDQFDKRQKKIAPLSSAPTSTGNATIERIPDPSAPRFEAAWDEEWEKTLLDAAVERVKKKVDPKHYQVFDLHVVQKWPIPKVAKALKIGRGRIYLIKHRINQLLKKEIDYLRTKPI